MLLSTYKQEDRNNKILSCEPQDILRRFAQYMDSPASSDQLCFRCHKQKAGAPRHNNTQTSDTVATERPKKLPNKKSIQPRLT